MTGKEEHGPAGTLVRDSEATKPQHELAHAGLDSSRLLLHDVKFDEAGLPIRRKPTPALAERVRRLLYG